MILPDLNLLLYAYNPYVPHHAKAAAWWESMMNGEEFIGLPNEVTLGFVRIATNPRLRRAAVPLERARKVVESWLAIPHARVLTPGDEHFRKTMDLMGLAMGSGALVSDASLAVYAMEHGATLCTNDTDFARFPGLSWKNPLA